MKCKITGNIFDARVWGSPENPSALIGGVKGEEAMEAVLLLTPTPTAAVHLAVLVSGEGGHEGLVLAVREERY